MDNPCPSTVCLVSGDRDFSYCLSILQNRGYTVVLVAPTSTHGSLREQADIVFEWTELLATVAVARAPPEPSEPAPVVLPEEITPPSWPITTWASIGIQCDPPPASPMIEAAYLSEEDYSTDDDSNSLDVPDSPAADYQYRPPSTPSEPFMHPLMEEQSVYEGSRASSPVPSSQGIWPDPGEMEPDDPPITIPAPIPSPSPSPASPPPPPTPFPPSFADLVAVLQETQRRCANPTRHDVAIALRKRNPHVYKLSGIR